MSLPELGVRMEGPGGQESRHGGRIFRWNSSSFGMTMAAGTRSREVEPCNCHKAAAVLAEAGFDCIRLADDWRGADFLAHYSETSQTLRFQLKTSLVIDRKYGDGQGPYICFPRDKTCGRWYPVKHSRLVAIVRENTEWLCSATRKQERKYGSWTGTPKVRTAPEEFACQTHWASSGFRECTAQDRSRPTLACGSG